MNCPANNCVLIIEMMTFFKENLIIDNEWNLTFCCFEQITKNYNLQTLLLFQNVAGSFGFLLCQVLMCQMFWNLKQNFKCSVKLPIN